MITSIRLRLLGLGGRVLDRRLGIDTHAQFDLNELRIDSNSKQHGFAYVPSPPRAIRAMFRNVPCGPNTSLIDFGSGKGRVLIVGAEFGFRSIVGVEFSPQLHGTAQRNIASLRAQRPQCGSIQTICQDAAQFSFPDEDLVLYFHNPFSEPVMKAIIEKIVHHFDRGRHVHVCYQQLSNEPASDRTDNVEMLRETGLFDVDRPRLPNPIDRILLGCYTLQILRPKPRNLFRACAWQHQPSQLAHAHR